ncbi:hypothetical protein CH251_05320 [Rhodococcus sp. 06-462-5]|uniref:hypothetical protein n=1 Tax=unclassified Rhodococcus (in: high G+C Gram-positive bacteria) TaxID=192944 RepID=UPI000B9ABA3C|nr:MULTISPECIES: hypothetical protein [unclassified Rhodococcus (in: high G+C Gram-positive bacteria)]OZC77213.1 hypothetical protein CH251_05320 [Rhodococcus sp. 06-462-5]OZE63370.1 hypothetical protein CH270_17900 [Rhodococcus sp. 02-925g]
MTSSAQQGLSLEEIRQFAVAASNIGQSVAHFALDTTRFTAIYREPNESSLDEIDRYVGDDGDVVDPLLSSHRLAKFYLISAGDALLSCCELVGRDFPMHVGSGALARVTAEHASKAMFLADPSIGWRLRILRAHALIVASLSEYKSSNELGARQLIAAWQGWRARTSKTFQNLPKQSASSSRKLIESQFKDVLAYDELSRPTHGNAVWLTLSVIQEQKGTNYARVVTLRNLRFALDATLSASRRLCELWALDPADVLAQTNRRLGAGQEGREWSDLLDSCGYVRSTVDYLSQTVTVDSTPDPQPNR